MVASKVHLKVPKYLPHIYYVVANSVCPSPTFNLRAFIGYVVNDYSLCNTTFMADLWSNSEYLSDHEPRRKCISFGVGQNASVSWRYTCPTGEKDAEHD